MEEDRELSTASEIQGENVKITTESRVRTPRRRFIGRREAEAQKQVANADGIENASTAVQAAKPPRPLRALNLIPAEILHDEAIHAAIALLPSNYSFEIHKTIHRIRTSRATRIALQFPEGLLLFATTISDILTQFCPGIETLIMGDVTYGACCIDDYTARALGCDLLVHYAHSCLIPVSTTKIATLYIFVDIGIDTSHLLDTLIRNFATGSKIAMVGTIQFNSTLHTVKSSLEKSGFSILIPQIMPLSKGEILGCTSPTIPSDIDALLYLGDGRFHLESAMIANPSLSAYRYDPYSRKLTREHYAHDEMLSLRSSAIATARRAKKWGLILGGLGRQGNSHTLAMIEDYLNEQGIPFINLLLSEIFPGKLAIFEDVECWVQIACPRLSIDWGYAFPRPLLTPYEALVVLGKRKGWEETGKGYPMDFYGKEGLGRTVEKQIGVVDVKG